MFFFFFFFVIYYIMSMLTNSMNDKFKKSIWGPCTAEAVRAPKSNSA